MIVSWRFQCAHASSLSVFALVLIAHQPMHASKCQDRSSECKKLLGVRRRQIHDHQLPHDGEQRDKDDSANLHDASIALCNHQKDRSNSSAMITVKIIPNSAWNTE